MGGGGRGPKASEDCKTLGRALPSLSIPEACCTKDNANIICNDNNRITSIKYTNQKLALLFPVDAISSLSELKFLNLADNRFTGDLSIVSERLKGIDLVSIVNNCFENSGQVANKYVLVTFLLWNRGLHFYLRLLNSQNQVFTPQLSAELCGRAPDPPVPAPQPQPIPSPTVAPLPTSPSSSPDPNPTSASGPVSTAPSVSEVASGSSSVAIDNTVGSSASTSTAVGRERQSRSGSGRPGSTASTEGLNDEESFTSFVPVPHPSTSPLPAQQQPPMSQTAPPYTPSSSGSSSSIQPPPTAANILSTAMAKQREALQNRGMDPVDEPLPAFSAARQDMSTHQEQMSYPQPIEIRIRGGNQ
ncbi:hypothetical protein HDU97_005776 [Phlyctochytrium planicorne]|nr:hypothetical protein HDU97_005776 [Phlyctochytrium planicorne]